MTKKINGDMIQTYSIGGKTNMEKRIIKKKNGIMWQKEGDQVIVSTSHGDEFCILNEMSMYILNICDGKTCEEIAKEIYKQCIDKEDLQMHQIIADCEEVIQIFCDKGIIYLREDLK